MLDKKKLHFWRLVFVFGAVIILALSVSYGYGYKKQSSMMNESMGNMMVSMHLRNITVWDLISQQEQVEAAQGQGQEQGQSQSPAHSSHHGGSTSFLKTAHYLTTAVIVILLPFIIAGTVFLAIIWLK